MATIPMTNSGTGSPLLNPQSSATSSSTSNPLIDIFLPQPSQEDINAYLQSLPSTAIKENLSNNGIDYDNVYAINGGYRIEYTGSDGKPYVYDIANPTGENYTQGELNTKFSGLHNYANSGSGSGSYYGGGGGYSGGFVSGGGGISSADRVANAQASNEVIETVLNKLENLPQAKQDFTISEEDYAALRAKYPNLSDEQLTNLIATSTWAQNFGSNVSLTPTTSTLKGATLEELIANAEAGNVAAKDTASLTLDKQRNEVLENIQRDPALYEAVIKQLRADTATGSTVGQRAANALNAARAQNINYKSAADTLYESTGGAGQDSLAGQLRGTIYGNLTGAYGSYIEQQLNKLATDTSLQTADLNNLITVLSLLNQGLQSEDAAVRRQAEDELARIRNEAESLESKAEMESKASIAEAGAALDNAANTANLASTVVNSGDGKTTPTTSNTYEDNGTGTYNKPELADAPYIDETLYKILLGEDFTKFLSQGAFDRYTKPRTQAELAQAYGLTDLLDVNNVVGNYQQYQQQANEASNRVFNDAQQAYVMAVAAGDAKTAEQLTRLAQQASLGRKNIYGATALANQFAQQNHNATMSDNMYYSALQQQAANNAAMSAAAQTGQTQWNTWVGNGNTGVSGNGFNQSYAQQNNNAAQALGAYGDLMNGAMSNQSSFNDTLSNLTNNSNTTLTNYANSLNSLNSTGATTNTINSATAAGIQNTLQTQQTINNNTIKKGGK